VLAGTVLFGSLAFAAQAEAQRQGGAGDGRPGRGGRGDQLADSGKRIERRVEMLTERLSLDVRQAAAIAEILEKDRAQRDALRPAGRPDQLDAAAREAQRAKMEEQRRALDAQIESVLTEEQRAAYRELPKGGRGGRGGPDGRGGQGGRGGRGNQRQAPPPMNG
jgi:Spy/CpxP family protein refolding chaperone